MGRILLLQCSYREKKLLTIETIADPKVIMKSFGLETLKASYIVILDEKELVIN
jgi:hypothetical protein